MSGGLGAALAGVAGVRAVGPAVNVGYAVDVASSL